MAWLRGFGAIYMTSLLLSNGCGRVAGEGRRVIAPLSAFFLCFYPPLSVLGIKRY